MKTPLALRVAFVARPGFEPRQTAPKTVVLPLYYQAILSKTFVMGCKNRASAEMFQIF